MSFILDALRKSETARRRSEAPDLFATMPGTTAAAPARAQWPLLVIGGVGVLSLIAALWLFAQRMPAGVPADTAEGAAANAPALEATGSTPPATADAARESATAGAPEISPVRSPEMPPVQPATAPAVASPIPPTAAAQTTLTPPPAPDVENTTRSLPAPPEPSVPPPSAPASQPVGDRIVSLADLDPEARKQLPPLKLSMHLWNETPSQRFVIVDGQRLKEGDVLGEIVVERIDRDGAVLVWRGNRLKIELR
jgi:general secretion pathway protein B